MTESKFYTLVSGGYYSAQPYKEFTRLWQASEAYLDVGAGRYRVEDFATLRLYRDNYTFTTWGELALRIVKIVSFIPLFPLALGALAIRGYYRAKWRVSAHLAEYKASGISSFTLTPKGLPIPSRAELLAKQSVRPEAAPALPYHPPAAARAPLVADPYFPPITLPPPPPAESYPTVAELGPQIAGNSVVRVLEQTGDGFANRTIVTDDDDGHEYLYIRGNGRDILIRK